MNICITNTCVSRYRTCKCGACTIHFNVKSALRMVFMSTTDEGEEQDIADQSEITEAVPMDTRPPPDPTKGLPQLFRSRRLSSDCSEDGESVGSRRNSISNGGLSRIPGSADNGVIGTVDNRSTATAAKESVLAEDPAVTVQPKLLSSVSVQKINVFDLAFSKKLLERQNQQEQPAKQVQPATSSPDETTNKSDEVLPTLTKTVKQEVQPAQPVIFQKPQPPVTHSQTRVLPPPLKLMSPTSSEHPNTNMPTQQPCLSPLTTRSPVQIVGMPRLPILSPLRAPTSANRHPMRIAGAFGHTAGSPSMMSPPTLRSPVDTISTPIEAHPNTCISSFPGPAMHAPCVHGPPVTMPPPPPPPPGPHSIPFSAHPPSQPFTTEPLQAQPMAPVSVCGPSILPTSAVPSQGNVSTQCVVGDAETIKSEEAPVVSDEQQLSPSSDEESKPPDEGSIKDDETQPSLEENLPTAERSRSVSASSSSSRPTSPVDKDISELAHPSTSLLEKDDNTARVLDDIPSLRPSAEEAGSDDVHVQGVKVERLSVSSVSADEDVVGSKISPVDAAVTDMGETSLKDLEISDDEGLSEEDEEEEEEEEGDTNENEGAVLSKSSSSPVEGEKDSSFQEMEPAALFSGKKMVMKEMSLSPVSSPGSELDAEAKLRGEDEGDFSTQDALRLIQVSEGQEEAELGVDVKKERVDSPKNFQSLSSEDEEATKKPTDQPVVPITQSELTEGQSYNDDIMEQELANKAKVNVQVLDSASVQYGDEGVQDMGTVEEVLEVLEQKLSSDEESEESDEGEEEEEAVQKEEVGGEEGMASEVGVVSGEGVMVDEEEEEDMVETLSAMVPTPHATVTTESVCCCTQCIYMYMYLII